MKKMVSQFGVLVTTVLLVFSFCFMSFAQDISAECMKPYKHISYQYGYTNDQGTPIESTGFMYDDSMWLQNAKELCPDIVKISAALASAAYRDPDNTDSPATPIEELFNESNMGFTLEEKNQFYEKADIDNYEIAGYYIGYKEIEQNGEKYMVYVIAVRGTPGSAEWISDFHIGTGDEHYGFHAAAQPIFNAISRIVGETTGSCDKAHRVFLFTGHSRGAAIADILAGKITTEGKLANQEHIFGYNFACPSVSMKADNTLTNIYNFINPTDIVPQMPLERWGYRRWGQTIVFNASDNDSVYQNMKMQFSKTVGHDFSGIYDPNAPITDPLVPLLGETAEIAQTSMTSRIAMYSAAYIVGGLDKKGISYRQVVMCASKDFGVDNGDSHPEIQFAKEILSLIIHYEITKAEIMSPGGLGILALELGVSQVRLGEMQSDLDALYQKLLKMDNEECKEEIAANSVLIKRVLNELYDNKEEVDERFSSLSSPEDIEDLSDRLSAYMINSSKLESILTQVFNIMGDGSADSHTMVTYTRWINALFYGDNGWDSYTSDEFHMHTIGAYSVTAQPSGEIIPCSCGTSIGKNCFSGSCFEKITIPDNIPGLQIGDEAFSNADSLTELVIPDNVFYIGEKACIDCNNLKSVYIGDVKYIGKYILSLNTLDDLTIPRTDMTAPDNPDDYAAKPTDLFYGHGFSDSTYTNKLKHLTILGGNTVVPCAFQSSFKSLETVKLPDSIEEIGENAFYGCDSLTTVNLPEALHTIGYSAFEKCYQLVNASFSKNIKYIGNRAFWNTALESVELPDNMEYLGQYAFLGCSNLKKAVVGTSKKYGNKVFAYCRNLTDFTITSTNFPNAEDDGNHAYVPKDLLMSDDSSLNDDTLKFVAHITVLQDIKIAPSSFGYISGLKTVTLPNTITEIGDYAFTHCVSLENINWPSSLQIIGSSAFAECPGITKVEFPSSIRTISYGAFQNSGLETVELPDGMDYVGSSAFGYCGNLKSAKVGTAKKYGKSVFEFCSNLTDFTIISTQFPLSEDYDEEHDAAVPKDLLINRYSNGNRDILGVQNVTVLQDTEIAPNAFRGLPCLKSANLPKETKVIGEYAFERCTDLETINLPDSLCEIGDYAFSYTGFKEMCFPDSLEVIGEMAFNQCQTMSAMSIGKGIKKIGSRAFQYSGLETVELPDNMEYIGISAFGYCGNLKSAKVGTANRYGKSVFEFCGNLKDFTITSTQFPLPEDYDDELDAAVPKDLLVNRYNNGNRDYLSVQSVTVLQDTEIAPYAFYGMQGVENVNLPKKTKVIGEHAFESCKALETVVFPESLCEIGDYAFADTAPKAYTIPKHVSQIGYCAFGGMISELPRYTVMNPECVIQESFGKYGVMIGWNTSTAHNYADIQGMEFIPLDDAAAQTVGDVNGDGTVNLKDVVLIRRYIAGGWNISLDEKNADLNGDGTVNLKDVVLIRRYIAGGWNVELTSKNA